MPHKGDLIPDKEWFATFDAMDAQVIGPLSDSAIDEEQACHPSRSVISRASRLMYQCRACGRFYIDGYQACGGRGGLYG